MRIALLTDGIYPYVMGGMQKHSYFLAKYLAQRNIEVDLYHYIPKSAIYLEYPFSDEELKYLNLLTIEYPTSKKFPGHYLYERYLYSKKIWEVFKNRPLPDFIYIKGFSGWALIKNRHALFMNIPVGVNFHGYEMFQQWPDFITGLKLQILKQPVKYIMSKSDYLFSYGGGISEIINCIDHESKIIEISTGIGSNWLRMDTANFPGITKKFVFVGRAERRKGIVELNDFLSTSHYADLEFHFIGPIEQKDQIHRKNVFYHGAFQEQEKLKMLLDEMDILVCPSYSEGMPNVILEGMSRGLAIIATNVGAVNQMVDSTNGWLIDQRKINQGLIKAFSEALNLPNEELILMKEQSLRKVRENFTWENVIDITIKKIENCLN